jgi:hypothetical protein
VGSSDLCRRSFLLRLEERSLGLRSSSFGRLLPEAAQGLLGKIELVRRRPALAAHDPEEQHGTGGLRGLELLESSERDRVLKRALSVEPLEQWPHLGPDVGEGPLALGRRLEDRRHVAAQVAKGKGAVADPLDRGEKEPLGRQLQVDRSLRQDAVLELEVARLPGEHVGEDALHLDAGGVAELALVDEAALGQHLGQGVPGPDLLVDLVELLAGDLAALDQDDPELIAGVLRGPEEDAPPPEIEGLRVLGSVDLERAGGPLPMKVHQDVGERGRFDVPADGERIRHPASAAPPRASR